MYSLRSKHVSVPSVCLGKNLRSKVFHCAKLLDGTRPCVLALKFHAGSPSHTSYISARWRSTDMCPCDAARKTSASRGNITCSISHTSHQRSVGILGGETAKQNLPFPALARSGAYPPPSCSTEQDLAFLRKMRRYAAGAAAPWFLIRRKFNFKILP